MSCPRTLKHEIRCNWDYTTKAANIRELLSNATARCKLMNVTFCRGKIGQKEEALDTIFN
ncbi:hypothetical protein EXN66_Car022060 [Channa argus]|uniref:Uncharacterized protein n=1 Tax=Channa argus TaxID=215402 RepID=A0A6G1QVX4_CHAAH|nr:hypothetical protein EXN66_Car022060 [Channa argus]